MENTLRTYPHRLYAHWNSGDMEAFYAMLHENVHDVGGGAGGLAQVRKILDHVRSAFPDSRYTVEHVIVDGERIAFEDATGHQGHTEGRRMQESWTWARAGGFEQDRDASFEGVSISRGGRPMCSFHVAAHGRNFHLNALRHLKGGVFGRGNEVTLHPGQWMMNGVEDGRKASVTVAGGPFGASGAPGGG